MPLSIFKQIIEVEYKETEMGYREINMEIILQALDKLIKLGNVARFFSFWRINILLLLQQGGKRDKCSNYTFMCVLFQACAAL